ncbi:hypothetical protein [Paraherbaspirillum soli]|uniref:DNA-binding domain-containing protein n=1 Tax=Paraherbaspirillum soli TaxID=631222 RepID=A0ABW0M8V0_9BURK
MNAHTVWTTWRRILREEPLHAAILSGDCTDLQQRFLLSDDEAEAALHYARDARSARWFVENYRFRMGNSFLNALETGAPLTLRALMAGGHEISGLATDFLNSVGWRDYGPFVYTFCADALDYLKNQPAVVRLAGMADLIGLEAAAVATLRRCAAQPARTDPHGGPQQAGQAEKKWSQTGCATLYRSSTQLGQWLRDKATLGRVPLPSGDTIFVAYFVDDEHTHRFATLPARAEELYAALAAPADRQELSARLATRGAAPLTPDDERFLALLQQCRAIAERWA